MRLCHRFRVEWTFYVTPFRDCNIDSNTSFNSYRNSTKQIPSNILLILVCNQEEDQWNFSLEIYHFPSQNTIARLKSSTAYLQNRQVYKMKRKVRHFCKKSLLRLDLQLIFLYMHYSVIISFPGRIGNTNNISFRILYGRKRQSY